MFFGACVEIYFACDTCEAPEVLVFNVWAVAPAHNLHCHEVFLARYEVFGNVELRSYFAVFAVAYEFAVNPDFEVWSGASHVEIDVFAFPCFWNFELAAVWAGVVVFLFNEGRVRFELCSPCVTHVLVCGVAISVYFEYCRHIEFYPFRIVVSYFVEINGAFVVVFHEIEFPFAFCRHVQLRGCLVPSLSQLLRFVGKEICAWRFDVHAVYVRVEPTFFLLLRCGHYGCEA